jgi:RimJ/RimL family protein N-acetyltransferase
MVEPDYSSYWQDGAVRLKAMRQEDWEDHFRSRFDSVARRLLQYEIELPPTVVGEKEMAATFSDFAQGSGRLMFVIETTDGIPVGGINLNSIDERHGTFSIGMQILRNYRGDGYGTAAMRMVLRNAFLERRLNKCYGSVIEGNVASARMLTKLGCAEEGRRREMIYTDGQYRDEILFGMTKVRRRVPLKMPPCPSPVWQVPAVGPDADGQRPAVPLVGRPQFRESVINACTSR